LLHFIVSMSEGDKLFASEDGGLDLESSEMGGPMGVVSSIEGSNNSLSSSDLTSSSASTRPWIESKHMTALFFHCLFKAGALVLYFLSGFIGSFILVFVFCVLLLAFDFWTVKNITGRLLVGLRWWNEVKEDGTNVWIYETKEDRNISSSDQGIFWGTMVGAFLMWAVFGITAVLTFSLQNLLIVAVALMLSGANLLGYWKCQRDARAKIQGLILSRIT